MFNKYPYTDFHELNLDWVIARIKELTKSMTDFEAFNKIKWGGLHDPQKEYERWTIVDTPSHEGYISIKAVPYGVTTDNTEYWMQVANYSALYASIQYRIDALEADMSELGSYINDDILIIFDSYGTTYANPPGDTTTIPEVMQTLTDRHINHISVSGGGFVRNTGEGTFYSNLVTFINTASASTLEKINTVIVAAGRNDWTASKADLKAAMIQFYDYCTDHLPNLKYKMFGYIANGNNDAGHGLRSQQYACYLNIKDICTQLNVYWMPGVDCVLHDYSLMAADEIHPSSSGKIALARALVQSLDGPFTWSAPFQNPTITAEPGFTLIESPDGLLELAQNDTVQFFPHKYISVTLNAPISTLEPYYDIASFDSGFIKYPCTYLRLPYSVAYQENGEIFPIGGYVQITPDSKLRVNIYAPSGIRAKNLTNIVLLGVGVATYPGAIC